MMHRTNTVNKILEKLSIVSPEIKIYLSIKFC